MKDRLQRYLDGELSPDALSPDERAEAEAWEALLEEVRAVLPSSAPADLEARVVRSLADEPLHGTVEEREGLWEWLTRPRPVPISPLTAASAAAALVVLLVRPWGGPEATLPPGDVAPDVVATEDAPAVTRIYVEFVLRAPEASSVSVAGDFNDWTPTLLEDVDGDGVWSGRVRLEPGVHEYMFVLDGSTWITDPNAERYAEDGFGNRNAVLAVAPGA